MFNFPLAETFSVAQAQAEPARASTSSDDETFFNLSPDPIVVGTLDGRITRINPAYVADVGWTLDDLQNYSFLDLIHPDDQESAVRGLTDLATDIRSRGYVMRLRCKDGVYRWYNWTARLHADGHRFYAIGRDVTAERESAARLAESQALLEQVLNGATDGVVAAQCVRDAQNRIVDFRITVANQSASEVLGLPIPEVVGKRVTEICSLFVSSGDFERMKRVVETGEPLDQEVFYSGEGRDRWIETTASRLGDGYVATFRDVTSRKQSQAALLERTAALQSIVSSALDGIITIDEEANITSFNPAAERIFGWNADEIIGRSLTLLCPPAFDGKAPLLVRLLKATTGRIVGRRRELLARRRDGSIFCMELSIGAYELAGKTVRVGVLRDVSAERAAAQRIGEANARFEIVEKAADSGVWDWNVVTNEVFFSSQWKAQLGYEPHEVRNVFDEWQSRLHPNDREKAFQVINDYLEGRLARYELEHRLRHRDGTYRTMLARAIVQRDQWGRPLRLMGANTDITALKESERALRDSQRALQAVLDSATEVGIVATDVDGRVTVFNRGAERLLGYTSQEIVGKHTPEMWHVPEEIEAAARKTSEALGRDVRGLEGITAYASERGSHECEWTQRRKDGRVIQVHLIVTATRDSQGNINGYLGVSRDVTEEKRALSALKRKNDELHAAQGKLQTQAEELQAKAAQLDAARREADAANLAKSEFLANMSHEIRTPMTAVLGYAQMLLSGDPSPEDRVSWIQGIERNGAHLLGLINDVLDLSKIEAGKMQVERIDTSLVRFVAEVDSLMRARALQKGLSFEFVFRTALPECVQTDPVRLRQILVNLLGNAIKFTHSGGVKVIVGLDGAKLRFDVVDTGVGMTAGEVARLFRPFTQADASTTRKFGGTGLGLTISRRLAELLGGQICVWSDPGHGSIFSAVIDPGSLAGHPLVPLNLSAAREPEGGSEASRPAPVKLAGRVLLAEDGPDNRRVITYHLERAGLDVACVENGRQAVDEALTAAHEGRAYDVILMDLQMPELDGYGAVAELRAAGYTGPIIALTAHALTGDREKCLEVGCTDYATKPIDKNRLLAAIARCLPGCQPS